MPDGQIIEQRYASTSELCRALGDIAWQRRPVVFRNARGHGPGGRDDILAGLRALGRDRRPASVYADGKLLRPAESQRCTARDASLEAYLDRLSAELPARSVACAAAEFETSDRRLWHGCIRFLTALHEAVGVPAGGASLELMMSNDSATPFGLSKGHHDALTWVVEGRQRYLVWPYDAVAERASLPKAARYRAERLAGIDGAALRESAVAFEVEPGDLLYRPWDHWFLVEPQRGPAVSLGLGTVPFRSPLAELEAVTAAAAQVDRFEPFVVGAQPDVVGGRVAAILDALDSGTTREELRDEQLNRITRRGLRRALPPAGPATLRDDDELAPPSPNLVAWRRQADQLVVSVNGHAFSVDQAPGIVELLAELNRAVPVRVGELAARAVVPDGLDREGFDALLGCLFAFHAFELTPESLGVRSGERPSPELFQRAELFPVGLADHASTLQLAVVSVDQHRASRGFIAAEHRVAVDHVLALFDERAPARPRARYVFTMGACEAPRIRRCIDAMAGWYAIHEPSVLDDWSLRHGELADPEERERWLRVLDLVAVLLFRATDDLARPVVVAGAGHTSTILEELLGLGEPGAGSAAVLLYARLPAYLAGALATEPRRLEIRGLVRCRSRIALARRLGLPHVDPEQLSDAQALAYAWLTDRALYTALVSRPAPPRLRALELDRWIAAPASGIRALADHLDLALASGREREIAQSKIFRTYAESLHAEVPYDARARAAEVSRHMQIHGDEIDDAMRWCGELWGGAPPHDLPGDLLDEPAPGGR